MKRWRPSGRRRPQNCVSVWHGVYALAVLSTQDKNKIVAARLGPPAVIGLGDGRIFCGQRYSRGALSHPRYFLHGRWRRWPCSHRKACAPWILKGCPVQRAVQHITWDPIMAEKGGFKHFMQKEIFEQPRAVRDTLNGRISLDSGKVFLDEMDITKSRNSKISRGKNYCLRYELACGAGRQIYDRAPCAPARRSRLRKRIPLSRSYREAKDPGDLHQPSPAKHGHACGAARKQQRRENIRKDLQRARPDDYAREANGTVLTHASGRKLAWPQRKRSPDNWRRSL